MDRVTITPVDKQDPHSDLHVRLFRMLCLLAAGVCLLVTAPVNLLLNLHWTVHAGNLLLGLLGLCFFRESRHGRHHQGLFLIIIVAVLDVLWFYNSGSKGSVPPVFLPIFLFIFGSFPPRHRWWLSLALTFNLAGLYLLEIWCPHWIHPYLNSRDEFLDLMTGMFTTSILTVCIAALMLRSYDAERKRQLELSRQLAVSEKNYREIFDSTGDALLVLATDGRILDANSPAAALFGVDRAQLLHARLADFCATAAPEAVAALQARMDLSRNGQAQRFDSHNRRAAGELFWAEIALRGWITDHGHRVIAAIRDISARKREQELLQTNEERLRLALDASRQGWFELNLQTGESVSSPEYIRMLGFEPEEFRSDYQSWFARMHPADREETQQIIQRTLQGDGIGMIEYRQQTKAGGWTWMRTLGKVVERDPAGRPLRMIGTHMDITERKEMERQLLHSQRIEAVGTLASGVAHDLNNILTPMLMASGILRGSLMDPKDRELMTLLDEGGRRGAAIVRQLLAFSRNLEQDRVPVDPRAVLREMIRLMHATFPKEIRIEINLAAGDDLVEADPNQLHQVLMNLCVNARDAMPKGGTLTLALGRMDAPPGAPTPADGPHVEISVGDTGEGIPPENIDRIFDPFFTTKPHGKGTGLGLASVHGIIKAHHGFVRVESAPGRGSIFRVYLPVLGAPRPVIAAPGPVAPVPVAPTGKQILVVDDDPAVLLSTVRMLEQEGFRPVRASGAKEALAIMKTHGRHIAVVVTDFSMPETDGPTLAGLLFKEFPALRIIGVSGLQMTDRRAELAAIGFHEILRKPYELDRLADAVRRQMALAGL